jgi:predicted acyl esterase
LFSLVVGCNSLPEGDWSNKHVAKSQSPVVIRATEQLKNLVIIEENVAIFTQDNTRLSAKVYRPNKVGKFPVVMSFTAYGKDRGPDEYPAVLYHNSKPDFNLGKFEVSNWTTWEAPDPAFWVPNDYVVIYVDTRGYHASEGKASLLSKEDGNDFYDAIQWASEQNWSNGNVGLNGVSYLAISQWVAASAKPPALKAIIPWEGQTDAFREVLYHGGIPETAFSSFWINKIKKEANTNVGPPKFLFEFIHKRPWLFKKLQSAEGIDFSQVDIPVLIAATWSDHGLHTRGSFEAFKKISSQDKWLYTHGQPKWSTYYSDDAIAFQKRFFDYYLKEDKEVSLPENPVRLEVRESLEEYQVRYEDDWPIPNTEYRTLYTHHDGKLSETPLKKKEKVTYDSKTGQATFNITFDEDTELSGNMKLKLWVSTNRGSDMDLFVGVKKFNTQGEVVYFYAKTGYKKGIVALGWLRVSERELDRNLSTPWQPVLTHNNSQDISRNEIVPVEIEILPSSTLFREGESLQLVVQGIDIYEHPLLAHKHSVNKGQHSIHMGGIYDSHLLVPVIPQK